MLAAAMDRPSRAVAHPAKPVRLRLWLPLTPLFWLLSPFALLLAPFLWLWLPEGRRPRNPFAAAIALGGVLLSLGGTRVDIDTRGARLFIRIL